MTLSFRLKFSLDSRLTILLYSLSGISCFLSSFWSTVYVAVVDAILAADGFLGVIRPSSTLYSHTSDSGTFMLLIWRTMAVSVGECLEAAMCIITRLSGVSLVVARRDRGKISRGSKTVAALTSAIITTGEIKAKYYLLSSRSRGGRHCGRGMAPFQLIRFSCRRAFADSI